MGMFLGDGGVGAIDAADGLVLLPLQVNFDGEFACVRDDFTKIFEDLGVSLARFGDPFADHFGRVCGYAVKDFLFVHVQIYSC